MSYTSRTKIENLLMIDISASFESQINLWISAVERYINNYTGRKDGFDASDVATVKYFDGNGKREIEIDDCVEVTAVEIIEADGGDVEWTLVAGMEADYITEPYNNLPIYKLLLRPSSQIGAFYSGHKRIKVTAKWGQSSSVPADIEMVATMIVGTIIQKGQQGGIIQSESLGDYSVTFANLDESVNMLGIKKILDTYKIFRV